MGLTAVCDPPSGTGWDRSLQAELPIFSNECFIWLSIKVLLSVNNAGIRNYGNEAEESSIILTIGQSLQVPVNMEVRNDNLCTSLYQPWRQKIDRLKQLCPPREGLQRHVIGLGCLLNHLDIINNHAQTDYFSSTQLITGCSVYKAKRRCYFLFISSVWCWYWTYLLKKNKKKSNQTREDYVADVIIFQRLW